MTAARSYGQHCGLAHALDLLGERWTLLVLRELMLGPKRYRDLLERLPMGTNLLAARLKRLEAAGLVERTTLPAPSGVAAYALTADGERLRPALEEIALWGYRLLPQPGEGGTLRAAWAALTMAATARRAGGPGVTGIVELHVEGGLVPERTNVGGLTPDADTNVGGLTPDVERLWLRCTGDDVLVRDGPAPLPADAVARMDLPGFYALATTGAFDGVEVAGDERLVRKLFERFRLPAGTPTAA